MPAKTSSSSGKRPCAFLEKSRAPPKTTSKTPPSDGMSRGVMPKRDSIRAARPAAVGP